MYKAMLFTIAKYFCSAGLLLALAFYCNCTAIPAKREQPVLVQPSSVNVPIRSTAIITGSPLETALRQQILAGGRFRLAVANDFNVPIDAIKHPDLKYDIYRAINDPCLSNDINNDGTGDLACLVVDTRQSKPDKFGLVIINGSSDNTSLPMSYWLYKGQDLSTVVIGWSRDGLGIRKYAQNGSYTMCHTRWYNQQKMYRCE